MGGVMPMESSETLIPDTAYNNNCDLPAAKFVYEKCQELCVSTATLSRWTAYGCPIRPNLMDELSKTKHMESSLNFSICVIQIRSKLSLPNITLNGILTFADLSGPDSCQSPAGLCFQTNTLQHLQIFMSEDLDWCGSRNDLLPLSMSSCPSPQYIP